MTRRYFDHNATTPVHPRVLESHTSALRDLYGNASSIHHDGQLARQALERGRAQVAALLGASPKSIVFCSGGTEADNTAIFGTVRGKAGAHIITTAIEHPAVLQSCDQLQREGAEVTYVGCGSSGVVDPDEIRRAVRPNTALISVMHVNNEVGTVQPVEAVAVIAREAEVPFHSDGVQAPGRMRFDVAASGITFYAISGHKLYAPKGIGALYVAPGAACSPLLFGGRHETARRAGTENVPGAVALGEAAALAQEHLDDEVTRLASLRDRFEEVLTAHLPDIRVNCQGSPRVPNTSSLMLDGIEGEAVVIALDLRGFAVSSGAACSSGAVEPSHVLTAIGLSRRDAKSCIRVSFGSSTTRDDADELAAAIVSVASRLRRISTDYVAHV